MRRTKFILFLLLAAAGLAAQPSFVVKDKVIERASRDMSWVQFQKEIYYDAAFFEQYGWVLGIPEQDEMKLLKRSVDHLGMEHHCFEQYHQGYPVHATRYILHTKDDELLRANGHLVNNIAQSPVVVLDEGTALDIVKARYPSKKYREDIVRPELVWFDPGYGRDGSSYRLAYRIDIESRIPIFRYRVFVDAKTGAVLGSEQLHMHVDREATAHTLYSGVRSIVTDSITGIDSVRYRLYESGRGGGIHTLAMDLFTDETEEWYNNSTTWDSLSNAVAYLDAHWGAERTYDYFFETYNHSGVDGFDFPISVNVIKDFGFSNAVWTGDRIIMGSGNGAGVKPFSTVDVVAHEFAHGLTQFSASLIYRAESGALNESFSDIFGKAVEYYARPEKFSWLIGAEIFEGSALRSMSDPNEFEDPKYYKGNFWFDTNSEINNGGVHTNSGVQNHWFYLLVEGGNGINERGDTFAVNPMGFEVAGAIAFRSLTEYLTPSSTYRDAYMSSLFAAEDLYGKCSEAYIAVVNAWNAVGVTDRFEPTIDFALTELISPESDCNLQLEDIEVELSFSTCGAVENLTDLSFYYQINDGQVVGQSFDISAVQSIGQSDLFRFDDLADLSEVGIHTLKIWIDSVDDNPANDTLLLEIESLLQQNEDFGLVSINRPESSCNLETAPVEISFEFAGCDSLIDGDAVLLAYMVNGDPLTLVEETVALPENLYPGDQIRHVFQVPASFPEEGEYEIQATLGFPADPFVENNQIKTASFWRTRQINEDVTFKFSKRKIDEEFSFLTQGDSASFGFSGGKRSLQFFGGLAINEARQYQIDFPLSVDEIWTKNPEYQSQFCMCVDAPNSHHVELSFDYTIDRSHIHEFLLPPGIPDEYSAALRVTVDGIQLTETYLRDTVDRFVASDTIVLDQFAGQSFTLCIESQNWLADADVYMGDPDETGVDNVQVAFTPISSSKLLDSERSILIRPNPVQDILFLEGDVSKIIQIDIFSTSGHSVMHFTQAQNLASLDLSSLAEAVYVLKWTASDGKLGFRRFVVVR